MPSGAGIACRHCIIYQSTEINSIVRGESMDILNSNRRILNVKLPFGWSNRIVGCGKRWAFRMIGLYKDGA